jgi:hypothetical protein
MVMWSCVAPHQSLLVNRVWSVVAPNHVRTCHAPSITVCSNCENLMLALTSASTELSQKVTVLLILEIRMAILLWRDHIAQLSHTLTSPCARNIGQNSAYPPPHITTILTTSIVDRCRTCWKRWRCANIFCLSVATTLQILMFNNVQGM